jgi:hypothetical protein
MLHKNILGFVVLVLLLILNGCGGGSPETSSTAQFAPTESPHKSAYFRYSTAPSGFSAVVGWMQAIDIKGAGVPNKVEVDWMKLHAVANGVDTVIYEENFDAHTAEMDSYGLYNRNPWFEGDKLAGMPFSVQDSMLVLEPSTVPNRVFHWWDTTRSLVPSNYDRIWFEARVRISGGAGVQTGIDYWKDLTAPYAGLDVNNTEAGVSDWFGNSTSDWQIISVGRP